MSINVEQIARECHEANKKYCEQIGDFSQPTWEDAPEWQKKSAMQGVQYFIENPDATPETMHENWKRVKVEDGWSKERPD